MNWYHSVDSNQAGSTVLTPSMVRARGKYVPYIWGVDGGELLGEVRLERGDGHAAVDQRAAADASAHVHGHVVVVHAVQDSGVQADVLVDDVQPQEGGERGLGAGLEPHGALVGGGGGTEHLAVRARGVPEAAHLQHEGGDPGLPEPERGDRAAVAGADDDRGGGLDRGGLDRLRGLQTDTGETCGGRGLEGDHAQYLTSRQLMLRQFCCHARSMCGLLGSAKGLRRFWGAVGGCRVRGAGQWGRRVRLSGGCGSVGACRAVPRAPKDSGFRGAASTESPGSRGALHATTTARLPRGAGNCATSPHRRAPTRRTPVFRGARNCATSPHQRAPTRPTPAFRGARNCATSPHRAAPARRPPGTPEGTTRRP